MVDLGLVFLFGQQLLLNISFKFFEGLERSGFGRELIVSFRLFKLGYFLNIDLKSHFAVPKSLDAVIFRESNLEFFRLAGFNAEQILFKAWDKGFAAQNQWVVFAIGATDRLVILIGAGKINGQLVTILGWPIDIDPLSHPDLQRLNNILNILSGHFRFLAGHSDSFIIWQFDRTKDLGLSFKLHFRIRHEFFQLNFWCRQWPDLLLVDSSPV